MHNFHKSHKLDNVHYEIRGPIAEEAAKMVARGENILRLNTGNPPQFGLFSPEDILRELNAHAAESEAYSDSKGLLSARQAIIDYCMKVRHFPDLSTDDVFTGNGVSEMIEVVTTALLDAGDEVLIPSPDYPLWTAAVTLTGAKAVHYICDEAADWFPDIADMKAKITSKTKAIVVINPNNPTGALYSKDLLEEIAQLARENDLILFSDEIYDRLIMDNGDFHSLAALAPDRFVVTMNGLSKSHQIPGFRVGWMVVSGPKDCFEDYIDGLNILASMRLCSNVLAQSVIPLALADTGELDSLLLPGGRLYEQREVIYNALNAIPGLSAVKPKAAFYIFPKIDRQMYAIDDDAQFVLDFLKQEKVLLVQGTGFNWKEPDHFRIVYLPEVSELTTLQEKLERFLAQYKR